MYSSQNPGKSRDSDLDYKKQTTSQTTENNDGTKAKYN